MVLRWLFSVGFLALILASAVAQRPTREDLEKKVSALRYQTGTISVDGGLAAVDVPASFAFLDARDAATVLTDLWGNPPDSTIVGMLVPKGFSPVDGESWAVVLSYDDSGYVSDKDAATIDYSALLKDMQGETASANEERRKEGYPSVDLVGWATPPHYDAAAHKLYWAKELKFGDAKEPTLNYAVRILGRRGVLELNAVAAMNQLPEIEKNMPEVLGMVNFNEGHRYVDFDPTIDKVAGYGLAALIAGGVAAKAGLFKGLIAMLLAGKKFLIGGAIALWAGISRFFKRRKTHPLSETNP